MRPTTYNISVNPKHWLGWTFHWSWIFWTWAKMQYTWKSPPRVTVRGNLVAPRVFAPPNAVSCHAIDFECNFITQKNKFTFGVYTPLGDCPHLLQNSHHRPCTLKSAVSTLTALWLSPQYWWNALRNWFSRTSKTTSLPTLILISMLSEATDPQIMPDPVPSAQSPHTWRIKASTHDQR